jgi:hypothetical protein
VPRAAESSFDRMENAGNLNDPPLKRRVEIKIYGQATYTFLFCSEYHETSNKKEVLEQ